MYPNILFFVVDSFRADRFFGNNKTSYTPNLDLLLKKGTYFEQTISSADGTFLTLSSLFNGLFPFVTNVRSNEVVLRKDNFLEIPDSPKSIKDLLVRPLRFGPAGPAISFMEGGILMMGDSCFQLC